MFDIRLREYTPAGVRGRVIPTLEIDSTDAESATSTLTFSTSALVAERMEAPFVVGLEYTTGSSWSQPRNNLYVVLQDAEDAVDQTDVMRFTAQSYVGWLLSQAIVWWQTGTVGNSRSFDMTPGKVVKLLLNEAQNAGRGWAPMLTTSFSDTADSLGQAWQSKDQIKMDVDLWRPYSSVFQAWIEQGHFEWWAEGTTLMLARLGTGVDLTSKIALGGPGFDSAPAKTDFKGTFSTIVLVPDKTNATHAFNDGADKRFGALETSMTMTGVSDQATAVRMAQPVMNENRAKKLELSFDWTPSAVGPIPWADFTVGDLVIARRKTGKLAQRVVGIQVSKNSEVVTARAIVGSKLVGLQAKLAKRVGSASQGGIIGGSGSGISYNPGLKRPDPIAPSGLVVTSQTYFDSTGTAYASVTATCSTVTTDVIGGTVKIKWYELWAKKNSSGESWTRLVTTTDEPPSMTYTGLLAGESWSFRVRAYADENVISAYSPVFSLVLAKDTTPPPTPAAPAGSSSFTQVILTHAGLTADGDAQPVDFSHFNVWMSTTAEGAGSKVGEMQGVPDTFIVPEQPVGQARWYWVTAEDRSGNKSGPSTRVSITTKSLVTADITQDVMDSITAIVSQSVVSNIGGTVSWANRDPAAADGSGKPSGAMWYRRDSANNVVGIWEWTGSAWAPRQYADATLGNLSAAKITSGFIDVARLQGYSITAEKLAVGDVTNYASGSDFEVPALSPWTLGAGWSISTWAGSAQVRSGVRSLRYNATAGSGTTTLNNRIEAAPGQQFYFELWASRSASWNGTTANSKLRIADQSNSILYAVSYAAADFPADVMTKRSGSFTVPAGVTELKVTLTQDATAGAVYIDDIAIRRMSGGELIVDGAITALKLAVNAVEADKIAANAITADKIGAGAVTTVKLDALAVTAAKLDADSVTAAKLAADAITVKHTITGAKFQTTATAFRGIEITSSGLVAYNSAGQQTVNINASTGAATFIGSIRNKVSGPRVEINSSDTRGNVWFVTGNGNTGASASIQSDPDGGEGLLLFGGSKTGGIRRSTVQLNEQGANNVATWYVGQLGTSGSSVEPMGYITYLPTTQLTIARTQAHYIAMADTGWTFLTGAGVQVSGNFTVTGSKNFAMDHPTLEGMSLVHASTESPHNGVEYWSDGFLTLPGSGELVVVLPDYFESLTAADHRVVSLTAGSADADLWSGPIEDGRFTIYGAPGASVAWIVKARRVQMRDGEDLLAFDIERPTETVQASPGL